MKSIQSRLSAGLLISLLIIFLLIWLLLSYSIQKFAENHISSRLHHDIETLLSSVQFDTQGLIVLDSDKVNPIYKRPFSGHYYSIQYTKGLLRSRSLWDQKLLLEKTSQGVYRKSYQTGPEQQPLIILSSGFTKQGHEIYISVAEDLTDINNNIEHFRNLFAVITLCTLALLLVIQIIILRKGLKPLAEIKSELTALEQGHISHLSNRVPQELLPLTSEINHLLSILHKRLQRSRDALSDLSHALKKPLTVLQQLTENKDKFLAEESKTVLNHQVQDIQQLTDHILKRARLAGNMQVGTVFIFNNEVPVLIKTINMMYPHKKIDIKTSISKGISKVLDREDMLELLGNLLDNAYKWANSTIHISIDEIKSINTRLLNIVIEDDGPGCEIEKMEQLANRGVRLDETTTGHGFGLAIAADIINDYEGKLIFERSQLLGGFKVIIQL